MDNINNTQVFKSVLSSSIFMLRSLNPIAFKVYVACSLIGLFLSVFVVLHQFKGGAIIINIYFSIFAVFAVWLGCYMAFEVILTMLFHYILPWLTNKITLCEPLALFINSDSLTLKFSVCEQISRRPLPRKGYRIEFGDDVEYTFFINRASLNNLSVDKEVCKITGASLIYLPKFIYTDEETNYNKFDRDYHIKMHDLFIKDDDFRNRDETYPWIIRRDEFSFIFMFDDNAKQALLDWSKK